MSRNVFATLCDLTDALQRLVPSIEPLDVQLAVTAIVDRLDVLIDDVIGFETAVVLDLDPEVQREEEDAPLAGRPCPVCQAVDCTHWQHLTGEHTP